MGVETFWMAFILGSRVLYNPPSYGDIPPMKLGQRLETRFPTRYNPVGLPLIIPCQSNRQNSSHRPTRHLDVITGGPTEPRKRRLTPN